MAGADVVDRHLAAELLQRRDDAPRHVEILERLALGHLEHDLRQADRRAGEDLAHLLDDLFVGEVTRGQVEAELDARPQPEHRRRARQRAAIISARVISRIRPEDSASGMNIGRRDDGAVGLAPAHQHLGADDRAACAGRPAAGSTGTNSPASSARSISTIGLERRASGISTASAMISSASTAPPSRRRSARRSACSANTAARETVAVTTSG